MRASVDVSTQDPAQVDRLPQLTTHFVPSQAGAEAGQTFVHDPQCAGSFARVSQPATAPSQSKNPAAQLQAPETQTPDAPQSTVHEPQMLLEASDASHPSWAFALQSANPATQVQRPPEHVWFAPHTLPQPPQFDGSELVSTSHALAGSPSQSAVLSGHTQKPRTHRCPKAQAMPQLPQFDGSVAAFTSQPSATFRLQSMNPNAQTFVQVAFEQSVPGHPAPQARQFCGSSCKSTQVPSQQVCAGPHAAQETVPSVVLPSTALASPPPSAAPSSSCCVEPRGDV